MSKKAKNYTAKEKATVALEAVKGNLTYAQITAKYGVHSTQINRWRKRLIEGMLDIFSTQPAKREADQQSLIDELYQQIGQLTVERDWLKKKSEIFR